jgi:transposase
MAARVELRELSSEEGESASADRAPRHGLGRHLATCADRPSLGAGNELLAFCRYVRSLYPAETRLHFVVDNFSSHRGDLIREWAETNNVELAYTPFYASSLNRIEPQFKALRYFRINGTDHPDHATQARVIRRYIAWRNDHIENPRLVSIVHRANTATVG